MKNKQLHLDGSMELGPSLEDSIPELQSGSSRRLRPGKLARAALSVAIRQELTPRQRECVQLYFVERLTLEEVGERLGIGKATVYKHIEAAKVHLRRVLSYAEAFQAAMDEEDRKNEEE